MNPAPGQVRAGRNILRTSTTLYASYIRARPTPGLAPSSEVQARQVLATHPVSDLTGRCLGCEVVAPCYMRAAAEAAIARGGVAPLARRDHRV